MGLSFGETAKAVGLTRQAIQAAIKKVAISTTKGENGVWQIDPAELFRVYQFSKREVPSSLQKLTPVDAEENAEVMELSAKP